jgi:DNA-binding NtrC family response regulator
MFIPVFVETGMSDVISYKNNVLNRAVLLVDPDNQMREIGKIMLKHLGFQVNAVSNRKEAVHELKRDKTDGEHSASLVILDLSDVNGESAIETCKVLRELDPELKVIAMCGTVLDPIMADYESYGFDTSLPKPYTMDTLRHVAHTVLST